MPYLKKVEDENKPGEFTYVEVPDTELELPADVLDKLVFQHPKYREVVAESVGRKERIRAMQAELEKLAVDDANKPEKPEDAKKETEKPAPAIDQDALYTTFKTRLLQEQAAEAAANKAREEVLRAAAKKHGLSDDALPILAQSTDPDAMAEALGRGGYRFDNSPGGAPASVDGEALLSNVLKNLGLGDN